MGAGFSGGISTYVLDYLKNRKKNGASIDDKDKRIFKLLTCRTHMVLELYCLNAL